jgi:hypothetical protein
MVCTLAGFDLTTHSSCLLDGDTTDTTRPRRQGWYYYFICNKIEPFGWIGSHAPQVFNSSGSQDTIMPRSQGMLIIVYRNQCGIFFKYYKYENNKFRCLCLPQKVGKKYSIFQISHLWTQKAGTADAKNTFRFIL